MMTKCRFGEGESSAFASGRPLHLFDEGYVSMETSIKECILKAMPNFPREIAELIDQVVKGHIEHDAEAQHTIRRYNLTQLEAEAIVWWTADVSTMSSSMNTEDSPYWVYNSDLRARHAQNIRRWRDYSFFFVRALLKLPPIKSDTFRGEKTRATDSRQYAKDNRCWTQSRIPSDSQRIHVSFRASFCGSALNTHLKRSKSVLLFIMFMKQVLFFARVRACLAFSEVSRSRR